MKKTVRCFVPRYFPDFSCKMGACRSACCVGWPVSVSMNDYFALPELRLDGAASVFHTHGAVTQPVRSKLRVFLFGRAVRHVKRDVQPFPQFPAAIQPEESEIVVHGNADRPPHAAGGPARPHFAGEIREIPGYETTDGLFHRHTLRIKVQRFYYTAFFPVRQVSVQKSLRFFHSRAILNKNEGSGGYEGELRADFRKDAR